MKIGSAARACLAAANCLGSSLTKSRARTLVSTARMPTPDLVDDRSVHFLDRLRRSVVLENSGEIENGAFFLAFVRLQQHALGPILDVEFHARLPAALVADGLWQDHLTLGGKSRFHGAILPVRPDRSNPRPRLDIAHALALLAYAVALE